MNVLRVLLIITASITVMECLNSVVTAISIENPILEWIMNLRVISVAFPLVVGAVLLHFAVKPKHSQPKLYMWFVVLLLISLPACYAGLYSGNFAFAMFNETGYPILQYTWMGQPKAEVFLGLRWYIAIASSSAVFIAISVIRKISALKRFNKTHE